MLSLSGHVPSQQVTPEGKKKRLRLYGIWDAMRQRCGNPKNSKYRYYGGKGVSVCVEWNDFQVFAAWAIANGYDDSLEIDRIKNSLGYCPGNCRWATRLTQVRNRDLTSYTAFGETKPLWAWLEDRRCTIGRDALRNRLRRGWDVELAITTPAKYSRK